MTRTAQRVPQDHTEGVQPYDQRGASFDRITHTLSMRIPAVRHGHLAWSQGEMFERLTCMHIATNTSTNCNDTRSIAMCRR